MTGLKARGRRFVRAVWPNAQAKYNELVKGKSTAGNLVPRAIDEALEGISYNIDEALNAAGLTQEEDPTVIDF